MTVVGNPMEAHTGDGPNVDLVELQRIPRSAILHFLGAEVQKPEANLYHLSHLQREKMLGKSSSVINS